jgi:hypothetical protein
MPDLEAAIGKPRMRLGQRRLMTMRFDPLATVDFARTIEPIKPIRWHTNPRNPKHRLTSAPV